jgi:pimeloyl-ACP methyl ester carboxylesterase
MPLSPSAERSPERDAVIELPDGRRLSYALLGAPEGALVVVLDGPGSRGLARAVAPAAASLGIRLVAPDRAGFGSSSPAPGQAIADWPADHAALLDALACDRAGIIAQSGGTPYALAAGAAIPQRVTAIGMIGAIAPLADPAALAEVSSQLRGGVKLARRAPWALRLLLRATGRNPRKAAAKAAKDLPPADAALMADPQLWAIHERATAEILSRPAALARAIGLLARPWGFAIEDCRAPVAFWSGERDITHPTSHSRRLAALLGDAPVTVVPDAATFGVMPLYGDVLRFAAGEPA